MEKRQIYKEFKKDFSKQIYKLENDFSDYVFLCIGTNKVVGDTFGPFVGQFLMQDISKKKHIHVIGNIQNNVSYLNVKDIINQIYKEYKKPCIIAVDSALSKQKYVGKVLVENKKMVLGEGIGKSEPQIGNISIKGIVAKNYTLPYHNFFVLKRIPIDFVINLAKCTAQAILEVDLGNI